MQTKWEIVVREELHNAKSRRKEAWDARLDLTVKALDETISCLENVISLCESLPQDAFIADYERLKTNESWENSPETMGK